MPGPSPLKSEKGDAMTGTNVSFPLVVEMQNENYTKNMITRKKMIIQVYYTSSDRKIINKKRNI